MLIDWFTVGAQLLNFLILVWLLKRFLYKPVLDAIDAREKRIAGELANAASKLAEAQQEHDEFDGKNKAFDAERGALAAKAAQESAKQREALLKQAHFEADALLAPAQLRRSSAQRFDHYPGPADIGGALRRGAEDRHLLEHHPHLGVRGDDLQAGIE